MSKKISSKYKNKKYNKVKNNTFGYYLKTGILFIFSLIIMFYIFQFLKFTHENINEINKQFLHILSLFF